MPDGHGAYMPAPDEVKQRAADLRWLYAMGFPDEIIVDVMWDENPPIERVVFLMVVEGWSRGQILANYSPGSDADCGPETLPATPGGRET